MGFYQDHCIYLPAMAGWFVFSALLSSYNKFVFGRDHAGFPCPLLMTSLHFFAQWVYSETLCALFPAYFGSDRISTMTWKEWMSVSLPCGLVTSADVGLSNLSLVTITITFYTMVKASTPVFVLIWAYLFGIERITCSLISVVVIIAMGEFLTVVGEVDFDLKGFILCMAASVLSGARWTLVQLKIQSLDPPLKTTVATMRLLAPSMFVSMLFISMAIERPWIALRGTTAEETIAIVGLGLLGACLAIAMIMCEFYLIMKSSAVILMIGGVIKELVTIFVGVMYFHDELNRINMAGCFVVFMGVLLYKITHHLDKKTHAGYEKPIDDSERKILKKRTYSNDATVEEKDGIFLAHDGEEDGIFREHEEDEEWNDNIESGGGSAAGLELRKRSDLSADTTETKPVLKRDIC